MRLTGTGVSTMLTKAVVIALVGAVEASAHTADVAGTWIFTVTNQATGVNSMPLMLEQDGRTLTGRFISENVGMPVLSGSVNGSEITLTFVLGVFGEPADVMFIGNIGENGVITGTMDIGGGLTTGTFTVVRAEGAATLPEPVLSPVAVAPELLNRSEVQAALTSIYPRDLRRAGIGGQALLWLFISETGQVLDQRVYRTSGNAELDAAALSVVDVFQFSPAQRGDEAVRVWIQFPITFQVSPRRRE